MRAAIDNDALLKGAYYGLLADLGPVDKLAHPQFD